MQEIERKFLVAGSGYRDEADRIERITQGFLSSVPERTVRVRRSGEQGWITVKGLGNASGTTRFEWEKEISAQEAESLLQLCEKSVIDKVRYHVPSGKHKFEVDEFLGENDGLVIAEIELGHESEEYVRPSWLGKEVTGQVAYYNAMLSKNPYSLW